jgi:hypothetical protein
MNKDQKLRCLRHLKQGDYIDAVVQFSDIWTVNSKSYVRLELIQFKKLDTAPKVEVINYFIDDNSNFLQFRVWSRKFRVAAECFRIVYVYLFAYLTCRLFYQESVREKKNLKFYNNSLNSKSG